MSEERRRRGAQNGAAKTGKRSQIEMVADIPPHAQQDDQRDALDALAFEEALARLDETVTALEGGQLPLDDALTLFEEGVRLAQRCQRTLDAAELRVQRLRLERDPLDGEARFALDHFTLSEDE